MAGNSQSLAESIKNIPPVTRFFTITTVIVCFANSLNLITPGQLMCNFQLVTEMTNHAMYVIRHGSGIDIVGSVLWLSFQSYRFFTAFMLPLGLLVNQPFMAIMDIYFFYTFANHLESHDGKFRRNFPDCLWFTLVAGTIIMLCSLFYSVFDAEYFPVHHQMMLSCVTYIWSRSSKNALINFLGIVPIKAYYLPLFNLFFKLIVNGYASFIDTLFGILGGYLYQCIQSDTLPFYNIFPGAYASHFSGSHGGRRVGDQFSNIKTFQETLVEDSIFDKGYLKAPMWLYKLLDYPSNTSVRTTAFFPGNVSSAGYSGHTGLAGSRSSANASNGSTASAATSSSISWFGSSNNPFKGKGHRLGD